jgi:glycosyltransferase involved in cell wall biosynthesis
MANYHPFVVTAYGSDLMVEPRRSRFRRLLVRLVLRQADQLAVPSPAMADIARRLNFPSQRLHIVPLGVETAVFSPSPNDKQQTRLSFGLNNRAPILLAPRRIAPLYHCHTLIAAIQPLIKQFPTLQLVMIRYDPDETYMARIEQKIDALGFSNHVSWLPAQNSHENMVRLYRMADIVISIPSSEGYGATVYEAMACGTPTIITDLPVFESEIVDSVHTLKVPVGDVSRTSAAAARLLDDQELYQTLATNGLEIVREKRASDSDEQTESIYNSLVGIRAK